MGIRADHLVNYLTFTVLNIGYLKGTFKTVYQSVFIGWNENILAGIEVFINDE